MKYSRAYKKRNVFALKTANHTEIISPFTTISKHLQALIECLPAVRVSYQFHLPCANVLRKLCLTRSLDERNFVSLSYNFPLLQYTVTLIH